MKYKYETHLHSSPVSKCAKASLEESLKFYKKKGYDGVFLTNHFIGGSFGGENLEAAEEQLDFYFTDFFEGLKIAREIGIKLFLGVEMTYNASTDFLVYGLSPDFYFEHPEVVNMPYPQRLEFLHMYGAFIVHAHPFRQKSRNKAQISLFPRHVDAVETINTDNDKKENQIARFYAKHYSLKEFAGSDNHIGSKKERLGGIYTKKPIESVEDFVKVLKSGKYKIFG